MKAKKADKKPKPKGKYYTEIKVKQSPDELLNELLKPKKSIKKK
ncbi:MAG TPA: hypothetical protein PLP23_06705 [Panacibacter sp.]|nr:hypothetical protein [Panacibacter sp.]